VLPGQGGRTVRDQASRRPLSALAHAARCHVGQRRESGGAPLVEHRAAVASPPTGVLAKKARRARRIGPDAASDHERHCLERYRQMRLEEHPVSLAMLLDAAPGHRLVRRLAADLAGCPISARRPNHVTATP
jgi:hypothetical protein